MTHQAPGARQRHEPQRLLSNTRLEVLPLTSTEEKVTALPLATTVTITSSPRYGYEPTVALAEKLAHNGFDAVPHLAARQFHGEAELAPVLDRLHSAGVRDLFVVGGDAPATGEAPSGEDAFPDGLALLQAIAASDHDFEHIGVPAYPEGHHTIDSDTLQNVLLAKQDYATYAVTQMCFDAEAIVNFATEARQAGVQLPLIAGVPGPIATAKLLRVGMKIGVGDSLRFLGGHQSMARKLLHPRGFRTNDLLSRIEDLDEETHHITGLHVYTFNEVASTLRWLEQQRPFDEGVSADDHAV